MTIKQLARNPLLTRCRQFGVACVGARVGRMAHVGIPRSRAKGGHAGDVLTVSFSFGGQLENGVSGTTLETLVASRRSHSDQRAPLRA